MKKIDNKQIFIHKKNLVNNYKIIREKSGNSKIMSVIKGDAYGHGIQECMDILKKSGCRHFYVARLEDAVKLRKKHKDNVDIYLLSGTTSNETCKLLKKFKITPIINNLSQLEIITKHSESIKIILHFDTGMNRLGFKFSEIDLIKQMISLDNIKFLMTHLSSADEENINECRSQLSEIKKINKFFNKPLSIANSSGIFLGKAFHLSYVRPGKSLYGINPFLKKSFGLKGVMSIYAPILKIAYLQKGKAIG